MKIARIHGSREATALLLDAAEVLQTNCLTKYCALSFFKERFLPLVTSNSNMSGHTGKSLALVSLVCLLVASKIHENRRVAIENLKILANSLLSDQHVSNLDFITAELAFLKTVNFEIGTGKLLFEEVEELRTKFRRIATTGKLVKRVTCLKVIDLISESQELDIESCPSSLAAASILAVSYCVSLPSSSCQFPLLAWLNLITGCRAEDIELITGRILRHILAGPEQRSFDESPDTTWSEQYGSTEKGGV